MMTAPMSIYRKVMLMWCVVLLLVLILMLGAKFVSNLIPIMGLLIPFYIKCTLDKLKCPKCEMPVTYQGKILGESYLGNASQLTLTGIVFIRFSDCILLWPGFYTSRVTSLSSRR